MDAYQFLEEFNKLKSRYPRVSSHSRRSENAEFGDYLYSCKNAYYAFDSARCQNIIYIFDSFKALDCCDGDYVVESENCYECVDVFRAYNCSFLNFCARIYDSHFCWDCNDSNNLFGCVHLNHRQYCIFNQQYTKKEYDRRVQKLLARSPEVNLQEMKDLTMLFPVTTTNISHAENCDYGNHVHYSSNLYLCFDATHSTDSGYLYDSHYIKNSYDLTQCAHSTYCYECTDSARLNNCFYMNWCEDMYDSGFCENCSNSHHLFGCIGLDSQEYCILNRQYSKEKYMQQVEEIMQFFRKESGLI